MLITNPQAKPTARLRMLGLGVVCAAAVLVTQLHQVQVKEGERYAEALRSQTTVPVLLSPARGAILDRNGVGLAENRASFDIDVYLRELVGSYSRANKGKLPKTTLPWNNRTVTDVDAILTQFTGDIVQTINLPVSYTRRDLLRHYHQQPNIPFRMAAGLDFATLSRFAEHSVNVPGVQETARPVRQYNFGALAPHVLGYIGQVEEASNEDFVPESIGKEGVERAFDSYLQGKPGGKILRKNHLGYILGVEAIQQPTIGANVYLSIDVRIQHIAEQAMRRVGRGACVIMDPRTGDVLAMVSVPNYDPNVFVPKVDSATWRQLTTDSTRPMFNRAVQGYATGSTFKTIVAAAALRNPNANFTPNTIIDSPGAIYRANRWWKDWNPGGRGPINLRTAMLWSCNTFFYQLGIRTGIESIVDTAKLFGLGECLLVDEEGKPLISGESAGVVPGPKWMEEREDRLFASWRRRKEQDPNFKQPRTYKERWSEGHTLNTSIGQGFVEATPLQMTTMISAIANGGNILQPRLVRAITRTEGGKVQLVKEYPVRKRAELGLPPAYLKALQDSLVATVNEGTGRRAGVSKDFQVAGKTGTAQFKTVMRGAVVVDNRAWFNGYAPAEDPRYAITVIVEGGTSGGGTAGPIVAEIMRKIHEMEEGGAYDLVYLTPAIGHYGGVTPAADAPPTAGGDALPPPVQASEPTGTVDEMAEDPSQRSSGASQTIRNFMERRRR
jgi:penicillin-binding protein 2